MKTSFCPICAKPIHDSAATAEEFFPFCSERCRQIDLYRWGEGRYAIVEPVSPDQLDEFLSQEIEPES